MKLKKNKSKYHILIEDSFFDIDLKCTMLSQIAFSCLAAMVALGTFSEASKLGDKGPGWTVKQYKDSGFLFCEYNGNFRISPGVGACQNSIMAFADPDQGCNKFHPVTLESASVINSRPKSTVFRIKPLKRGSDGAPKGYQIIGQNGCVAKYLALPKDVSKVKPMQPVPVELDNSKKWVYRVFSHGTDNEGGIDCLNDVDIMSQNYYTSLWVTSSKKGCTFDYDGDESSWKLTPV